MKSKDKFLCIAFATSLLLMLSSRQTNSSIIQPAAGNNGAPNTIPPNQTCAQCHSGGAPKDAVPNVDFTFNDGFTSVHIDNFEYELNKTYVISYVPLTTSKRYGFQMSALTSTNANGGTFALTDAANTTLVSTPTTYVSHHNASSFHFWTFQWTAPSTNVGDITFYYVFNASDSSNTETGDTIYVGASTVHAATTGVKSVSGLNNISLYPNPVKDELNISFDTNETSNLELNLFSLQGELIRNLSAQKNISRFSSAFKLNDLASGIYLFQIKTGAKSTYRKVVLE